MSVEERKNIDRGLPTLRNRNEKVVTKMPPLSEAAIHGDLSTIDQLLKDESLNVNELDEESMSALHWAAAYGEAHIVKKLLEHPKINAGITNKRGSTPLHQAVLGGAHEVLRVLLTDERVRKEVDASNMWGETALNILAATRGDSKAAAILLIEGKANKETKDKWGKSAIDVAEDYGEKSTAELLLNYSPGKTLDELIVEKPKTTPQTIAAPQKKVLSKLLEAPLDEEKALKWIVEPEMDINGADYLKWTAIHKCAAWEKPVVLKALLDHPKTHVRGMDGDTILHTAASSGATRCVNILMEDKRIEIDATNDHGVTPLMLAAGSGNTDVVNALLGKGADPNKATTQGKTAWNFAKESQADWIATMLWPLMSSDVQSSSSSLFSPPPPRPSRPAGKLSAKLVAIQDAVRNKKD